MSDLKWKLIESHIVHNVWGTFVADWNWFSRWYNITRLAFCRLQFEIIPFNREYEKDGLKLTKESRVINIHTIKPIDRDIIIKAAKETGVIVTAEEHNVIGGLGSAVAEVVCETVPVPVLRVGVEDTFGKSGPAVQLLHEFGLDAANIVAKCKAAVALKK